jgi:hypothetical protein
VKHGQRQFTEDREGLEGPAGENTANRQRVPISTLASEYDQRYEKTLGQFERELRGRGDFLGIQQGGRLLDYACGTGLLSRVG